MKICAFAPLLLLCSTAYGQALECPKTYPANGKENAAQATLVSAGVTAGEDGRGGDLHGDIHEFKGGRTVQFALPIGEKYFVCIYGKGYEHQWAMKLDENLSQCKLTVLDKKRDGVTAKLTCK